MELGDPFLGTGTLDEGFELPSGAVWQPSLILFGTYRTAVQVFDNGVTREGEWVNRLDLFANLQLSGTERLLFGIRPLDQDNRFTGYNFTGPPVGGRNELNGRIRTLFFEGEIGELFPNLGPEDSSSLDFGFAIGRQPLFYQEGMLINDDIDAVGVIRNTLLPFTGSDLQLTFVFGWNNIHRDDNTRDSRAKLVGLFSQGDFPVSTINIDFAGVVDTADNTDGFYWGMSSVQRIGHFNTSFRFLGSKALGDKTEAISTGYLLFSETSWTPPWTHDLLYANAFWGIDNFSSAARDPATGGPLGRTGILFAAVGIGRYGATLGNRADDSAGAAIGYQLFADNTRRQIIFEFGGRHRTKDPDKGALAWGARFQQAVGQHMVLQLDASVSAQKNRSPGWGSRFETRFEF